MSDPPMLAYYGLPAGSDLSREFGADGSVTIRAPAGEPTRGSLAALSQQAAVFGSIVGASTIGLLVALFYGAAYVGRLPLTLRAWAIVWFAVFCLAAVALFWRLRYIELTRRLRRARRQSTILHVPPAGKLIVETAGPGGEASYTFMNAEVADVSLDRGRVLARVAAMRVTLKSGDQVDVLRGRDSAELRWVVETVRERLFSQ